MIKQEDILQHLIERMEEYHEICLTEDAQTYGLKALGVSVRLNEWIELARLLQIKGDKNG